MESGDLQSIVENIEGMERDDAFRLIARQVDLLRTALVTPSDHECAVQLSKGEIAELRTLTTLPTQASRSPFFTLLAAAQAYLDSVGGSGLIVTPEYSAPYKALREAVERATPEEDFVGRKDR
jgi:hypothetical protein